MVVKDVTPRATTICPACHRLHDADKRCRYCYPEPKLAALAKPAPRLLSTRDAATYLAVSPKTIRRLVPRGLPVIRINRLVRFDRADLDRFAEQQKQLLR